MLPQGLHIVDTNEAQEMPTRTYKLDFEHKQVSGYVDGIDAMAQAVRKIFETERYAFEIYTHNYGIEFENLIGQSPDFVIAVLESRITDALSADDRFIKLQDFAVTQINNTEITVSCKVITTQGIFEFREELNI